MKSTPEDPIVAEIRETRRELMERFGSDVNALCDFLAQQELEHKERLVSRPAKAPQYARVPGSGRPE